MNSAWSKTKHRYVSDSSSSGDPKYRDGNNGVQQIQMDEALRLFRTLLSLSYFREARIVLLLTKLDLFENNFKRKPRSVLCPEDTERDGDASALLMFITLEFLACNPYYNKKIELGYFDTTDTAHVLNFLEDLEGKITDDLRRAAGV